jgi:hypothetical protein
MNHSHRSSSINVTRKWVGTAAAVFTLFVWALFVSPSARNRSGTPRSLTLQSFSGGALWAAGRSGTGESASRYKVLTPISHGNLTIFPVVADLSHDTSQFLTLDEGLRSGEVVVTEAGKIQPLMRRRSGPIVPHGDQVNQLVLVNNSDRPLILLAGEIVTGGKQDRVVGKDRIVPPKSDPIDLSVFCVEPGRWVETSSKFTGFNALMAQPSVRKRAMADKNQQEVWAEVRKSADSINLGSSLSGSVPGAVSPAPPASSYARAMASPAAQSKVDAVAAPLEHSYDKVMRELRERHAVGVVVAVNGEIIWADIFASTSLLEKYWPKLVRSYAAEAVTTSIGSSHADVKSAQAFIEYRAGKREVIESDPGVYRHTEMVGDGYRVFELASLLPNTGFDIHIAKMSE